jgi:hypothetical protein
MIHTRLARSRWLFGQALRLGITEMSAETT